MAEKTIEKENIMGTEKISKLVFITGVPMIVSLLINSLYNFVDSVFVSRLSENALTAVSLASPVQLFISSLGLGIAVGLNAVISRALGAQKPELVKKTASAAVGLAFGAWGLIVIACLLFLKPYFEWQAAGNEEIAGYGMAYLRICMLFSLGQMLQWVFDRFVMARGKGYLFLFTLSAASVTNFILDPILIFGYFGMPEMGIEGAAAATVIGQFVGAGAGLLINKKYNREIPITFSGKPDGKLEIAPQWVLSLFQAEGTMLYAGSRALRIMAAAYFLSIFCLVCAAVFQGLSLSTRSMYLALMRQVLLPLLLLVLFRTILDEYRIWWIFAAAEAVMIPAGALAKRQIMEKIKPAAFTEARS